MNPFDTVVANLTRAHHSQTLHLGEREFSKFMREYTFDKLSGIGLAQSFMQRFHIEDEVLSRQGLSDHFAHDYIQGMYVRTQVTQH